jgi:hypothetical protein
VDLRLLFPVLLLAVGCGGGQRSGTAPAPADSLPPPTIPLLTEALAGQPIAVLPLTLAVADSTLAGGELFRNRTALLAWADSIVGEKLMARAPEIEWKLPSDLRDIARRSPGVVTDPDRMGQAVMRAPELDVIPDPFRSHLRSLVAISGGRHALVPAALVFRQPEPGLVRVEFMLVLGDARSGQVLWRTLANAAGGTPAAALGAAMDAVLPIRGFEP